MQPDRREFILKVILVGAIFAMAGPELIPAFEMTLLLELLGATLFLVAFRAGLQLVCHQFLRSLADLLLPASLVAIYRQSTRPFEKGQIIGYLAFHAVHTVMLLAVCVVFVVTHVH